MDGRKDGEGEKELEMREDEEVGVMKGVEVGDETGEDERTEEMEVRGR